MAVITTATETIESSPLLASGSGVVNSGENETERYIMALHRISCLLSTLIVTLPDGDDRRAEVTRAFTSLLEGGTQLTSMTGLEAQRQAQYEEIFVNNKLDVDSLFVLLHTGFTALRKMPGVPFAAVDLGVQIAEQHLGLTSAASFSFSSNPTGSFYATTTASFYLFLLLCAPCKSANKAMFQPGALSAGCSAPSNFQ